MASANKMADDRGKKSPRSEKTNDKRPTPNAHERPVQDVENTTPVRIEEDRGAFRF